MDMHTCLCMHAHMHTYVLHIRMYVCLCICIYVSVHAISWNGMEPMQNILQDARMQKDHFYNCNRHSGQFLEGARGL